MTCVGIVTVPAAPWNFAGSDQSNVVGVVPVPIHWVPRFVQLPEPPAELPSGVQTSCVAGAWATDTVTLS